MSKILFDDRDGQQFEVELRGAYSSIKSQKKLKEVLDKSILAQRPYVAEALNKKSYMEVMRWFGMISKSKRIL